MTVRRFAENPLLTPAMVMPSRPDYRVVGVFNPAVVRTAGETLLLLRVAEAPLDVADDEVAAPCYDHRTGELVVRRWKRGAAGVDSHDRRLIQVDGQTWLTSISHLRLARSLDGVNFRVDPQPALAAAHPLEAFGLEDARITTIAGTHWINYTAVSSAGIGTALASSVDMREFTRHGIIFAPPNRDVVIFPEQHRGRYLALHRPMPEGLGQSSIWLASSPDLLCWGDHRLIAEPRVGYWDDLKLGAGAPPFKVEFQGRTAWLAIYHGVTRTPLTYSLGAVLLDGEEPSRVLARSDAPLLAPTAAYERSGFFGNVVFSCGQVVDGDRVRVYYGSADGVTCAVDLSLRAILAGLV